MSGIKHNNYEVLLLSKTGNININNNKISTNIEKNRIKSTKKYFLRNNNSLNLNFSRSKDEKNKLNNKNSINTYNNEKYKHFNTFVNSSSYFET